MLVRLFFSYATLSDQRLSHTASDNYWYDIPPVSSTSAMRRMMGNDVSNVLINWYHQGLIIDSSNVYNPYLIKAHPLRSYITPIENQLYTCNNSGQSYSLLSLNSDTTTNAEEDTLIIDANEREQLMGEIVKDSVSYQNLEQEHKYFAREFAYKLMDETPAYMNMSTSEDTIYQYFYDTINNSNSGSFYQTSKYINDQNYSDASSLVSGLTGANTIENNRIAVHSIYLNKVVKNQFLGESDSLTLIDIAYQSALTGGDAVISARVILGILPLIDDFEEPLTKSMIKKENAVNTQNIKVYPNPAYDKLYIMLDGTMDGMTKIEMFDLTGKLIYNTSINAAIKLQTLNINTINKGIYNLRITTTNKTYNQKLVIIR